MAYPFTPTPFTKQVYESLPEFYREDDAQYGYDLLRWLSLILDEGDDALQKFGRIRYVPVDDGGTPGDTSDLTDPDTANVEWLDWLAQLVGVALVPEMTEEEKRDAIRYASSGWQSGTKTSVAAAAKSVLTGSKYAKVYDHSTDSSAIGAASVWDVLIVTRQSETPDPALVLATVVRKRAKPAGVVLWHKVYLSSWSDRAIAYPTWQSRTGKTWGQLQEAGLA